MSIYDNNYININGNFIHETAIVGDNVIMGKGNIVMPYSVIGQPGFIRDSQKERQVIIGNNNRFGCNSMVMSGETIIGNDNLIMNAVNIGHNALIGDSNEIGAGTVMGGYVVIGNNNRIKLHCTIRNRIKIGDNNIVGMASNVVKDIADKEKVRGNPAK